MRGAPQLVISAATTIRTANSALKVLGLAVGACALLVGSVASASGDAGWAVFALLVLSAVVVAIAQQTLP